MPKSAILLTTAKQWIVFAMALATAGCVGYEMRSEARSLVAAGAGDQVVVRLGDNLADVFVYRQAPNQAGMCVIQGVHSYRDLRPVRQAFEAFALPAPTGACPKDAMAYATLGTGVDARLLHELLLRLRGCVQAPDARCGDFTRPAALSATEELVANLDKGMPTASRYGDSIALQYWLDLPHCMMGNVEFEPAGSEWHVADIGCAVGY